MNEKKMDEMLTTFTAITGLTFEDILREASTETIEELEATRADNLIKMNEHLSRPFPTFDVEVKDEKDNPV